METVDLLCMHSKLLTFGVGMYLSCQVAVSSLFHPLYPSKINHGGLISWEADMPPLCNFFLYQVRGGIFLGGIHHIRTEN